MRKRLRQKIRMIKVFHTKTTHKKNWSLISDNRPLISELVAHIRQVNIPRHAMEMSKLGNKKWVTRGGAGSSCGTAERQSSIVLLGINALWKFKVLVCC